MVGPVELYTDSSNIKLELVVGPVKSFINSCDIKQEQFVWSIKVYTDGGNIKLEQVLWVTRLLTDPSLARQVARHSLPPCTAIQDTSLSVNLC